MKRNTCRNAGFTLVELLVVIAIIGILISLIIPSIRTARDVAMGVACGHNLKQVYYAFDRYADEHEDTYPAPWREAGYGSFRSQWPYLISESVTGVALDADHSKMMSPRTTPQFFCPKMMEQGVWWWYKNKRTDAITTYGMATLRKAKNGNQTVNLAASRRKIVAPTRTVLLGDGDAPKNEYPGYPWMNAWLGYSNIRINPHRGKSNFVFCDGHVESLAEEDLNPDMFTIDP